MTYYSAQHRARYNRLTKKQQRNRLGGYATTALYIVTALLAAWLLVNWIHIVQLHDALLLCK